MTFWVRFACERLRLADRGAPGGTPQHIGWKLAGFGQAEADEGDDEEGERADLEKIA